MSLAHELRPNATTDFIGRCYERACIDTMAEDLEMDAEDIASDLEACGYSEREAERLSHRPWAKVST